jgi:integrase
MSRPRNPPGTYGVINVDLTRRVRLDDVPQEDGTLKRAFRDVVLFAGEESQPGDVWRARSRYRFRNGKNKQVERFGTTKKAAENALKKALNTIDDGSSGSLTGAMKLTELAHRFMVDREAVGRTPGTIETYRYAVDVHIIPEIGQLTVAESTPENLQAYLSKIARDRGAGAAKNSRSVLSGMFGLAVRNGAALRNPVRELERIKHKQQKGSRPLPLGEAAQFLEAIRNDDFLQQRDMVDLLTFMFSTGWRIGEVCGLTWDAVDLEEGTATMQAISVRVVGVGMVLQPFGKSTAAHRVNALPESLVQILRNRLDGQFINDMNLVFPTPLGKLRDTSNTGRDWRLRRDDLGFDGITSHSLRKMVGTALDGEHFTARDIADVLGHRNASMTQDKYMARNTGSGKAAQSMEKLLNNSN